MRHFRGFSMLIPSYSAFLRFSDFAWRATTVCGELLKYNFAIINRGILVNLDHIQNITKYDIILSNGRKIPIGKTYKDEIVARYLNYATGR